MSKTKIIQSDRSHAKVFRELKDVLIRLSSNSKVHQTIDIIVVDILEAYGVILSRDWLAKLMDTFPPIGLIYGYHTKVSQTRSR